MNWLWARRAYIALAVGLLGGVIRVEMIARDAADTAEQLEIDRNAAAVSACVRDNIQTERDRAVAIEGLLALAPQGQQLTPDQQARFDHYRMVVTKFLPYRDCSPEGLAAYFEDPPPDPAKEQQ